MFVLGLLLYADDLPLLAESETDFEEFCNCVSYINEKNRALGHLCANHYPRAPARVSYRYEECYIVIKAGE